MKRFRVWIQAEYEFPDDAELVDVVGETAVRLGDQVIRPNLDFLQLQESTAKSSIWIDAEEDIYESVLAGERQLVIDFLQDRGAA